MSSLYINAVMCHVQRHESGIKAGSASRKSEGFEGWESTNLFKFGEDLLLDGRGERRREEKEGDVWAAHCSLSQIS